MDYTDSRIIFRLLRNPRESLRGIASDLDISAQDMNYRMKKIKDESIVRKYMLHVNPVIYGRSSLYLAFHNNEIYSGAVSSIIKCLEKTVVYGFSGTKEELEEKKMNMINYLGHPVMEYSPGNDNRKISTGELDMQIINILRTDPLKKSSDVARILDIKSSVVEKRIERLLDSKLISIIPKLDLSKLNVVILGIFSSRLEEIQEELGDSFLVINDKVSGIILSIERDIYSANSKIQKLKKIDNDLDTMIIYDYDFFE
jgi:DNA-binding Lrp family transcriptional regulator